MNDHVKVLKYARRLIASGQRRFICHALSDEVLNLEFEGGRYKAVLDIKEVVRERLRPDDTLESWLMCQAKVDIQKVPATLRLLKLRETRLAWIDSLIEEFSG